MKKKGFTLIELISSFAIALIILTILQSMLIITIKTNSYGTEAINNLENTNIIIDEISEYVKRAKFAKLAIQCDNNDLSKISSTDSKGNEVTAEVSNLYKPLLYIEPFDGNKPYFVIIKSLNGEKELHKYYKDKTSNIILDGFDNIDISNNNNMFTLKVYINNKLYISDFSRREN